MRYSYLAKLSLILVASSVLPVATSAVAQQDPGTDNFTLPAPQALAGPKHLFATAYIVQAADESTDPADPALVSPNGQSLGVRIPRRSWCLAADEGSLSVRLKTGENRAYVYAGRGATRIADCSAVFTNMKPDLRAALEHSTFRPAPTDAPYGIGSIPGYRLVPYRSIAIDRASDAPLKLGQVIFIPKLRGASISLGDGRTVTHDGYVMAVDTGGAIKGTHIDFFEGPRTSDTLLAELATPFDAYVVTTPDTVNFLSRLHQRQPKQ